MPIDFVTSHTRGYAFVNLTSPIHVEPFFETFVDFSDWQCQVCRMKCHVQWSEVQTLQSNILRYKDSTIMLPSVPDAYKPIVLKDGVRIPFPQLFSNSRTKKGWRRTTNIACCATGDRLI
ncbi:unnamed protein product [Prorocentrum cordatum]|uniref:Mei2-like C-terminal RNA recognition motif domain-containing protein n=1 Tax=Prorocentrum cordatum TaxID=2364126 RepID=A0ABN9PVZ9_9DINO|nr:unnamed protein product [Polarella glacialis]